MTDLATRFLGLYTGAVADVLDAAGHRRQVLPSALAPVTLDMRMAGPAFPGRGVVTDDITDDDSARRLAMLEEVPAGSVTVWDCGGHDASAHWGEIMTIAARSRGCVGAVVDGGVRDTSFILELGFPVFSRFRSPASSIGRWNIIDWNRDIRIGETLIHPGDWIFADVDGVVVVPRDLVDDVLAAAEAQVAREKAMRAELQRGSPITEVFARHGTF